MNNRTLLLAGVGIALLSFGLVFFLLSGRSQSVSAPAAATATPTATPDTSAAPFPVPVSTATAIQETRVTVEQWTSQVVQIIWHLLLAVALSALLAFRPRKDVPLFKRNLYVAQTQILLAVVAAALMMIVGDNTARAFAIFAAVSLVRFRTNIRDPKEVTVLLISLAIGLATGVGRWELALILCLFVLPLLWFLEYREPDQVYRPMKLTVKTRDIQTTHETLKDIFNHHHLESEVRQVDPPQETDAVGSIMYYLNIRLNLSTDRLSEEIFTADPTHVEGLEWEQQKNVPNVYQ